MGTRRIRTGPYLLLPLLLLFLHLFIAPHPTVRADAPDEPSSGAGTEAGSEADASPLATQLEELAQDNYGSYGIYLNILETGECAAYNADRTFSAASCYKLFLVMYIYENAARGKIDLNRAITYEAVDVEGEEGVIRNSPLGTGFTTRELCRYAIVYSDNVAARMLKRVYGYHKFRDYAASIGCPVAGTYHINSTTAREMGILFMRVLQFAQSDPLGREVVAYLEESTANSGIPAGLPDSVEAGNKTGYYEGCVNDAAVVFMDGLTYILCVMSKGAPGFSVHAEASRLVYEDIHRRYYGGGDLSALLYQPSSQWYFAEVSTQRRFETWLCLSNGGEQTANVAIRPLDGQGSGDEMRVAVPPESLMSLRTNQFFGINQDIALDITSDVPILAERATYYEYTGGHMLGSSAAGSCHLSTEWFVSGGGTHEGVDALLHLANPGAAEAHCTITAMAGGAQYSTLPVALPALGRQSISLNDLIGNGTSIALCVISDTPVVVEKTLYMK